MSWSRRSPSRFLGLVATFLLLAASSGCSVKKAAVRSLASGLTEGASVFSSDPDPELVGQALPFTLKTLEALLEVDPENRDLLLAACSGFTQYSYAFVQLEAERLEPPESTRQLRRATDLYLRARGYCFRGLDTLEPGLSQALGKNVQEATADFDREHMDLLYWTAASWGSAVAAGRHDPFLGLTLPVVRALFERLLEMDEKYQDGVLHDAMIALEALPESMGGSLERARRHYERAVELSGDTRVGTHLSWAYLVALARKDEAAFEQAMKKALAVKLDRRPEERLANTVNRQFAESLLSRRDELFGNAGSP